MIDHDVSYSFEVYVDDDQVAAGYSPDAAHALREGKHYEMMYAQEGEVEVVYSRVEALDLKGLLFYANGGDR